MKINCKDKKIEKRFNEVFKQMADKLDFNIDLEDLDILMDLDSNTLYLKGKNNDKSKV